MPVSIEWLGSVAYERALELQREAVAARRAGRQGDRLLLLEHPPVVTLGRSAKPEHLLLSPESLAARGVELHEAQRGGDVTYHAPGQLVGYPILDLRARGTPDLHRYLRDLETVLIEVLEAFDVPAGRVEGWTGVFARGATPPRKLASIGVGVRGWVTFHGFALNVSLDLAGFESIVPCGLHQVEMSSLARELGERAPADLDARVRERVERSFAARFA
ncbi:MAG: lipoyl(octanoyl) transferase LipB [Proteobacteria bacterium]|nr:lipoyl(octanoyl) transferase LipB [Pseudomonadota bacterium]